MQKYLELVELQKETVGASFIMGYSTRSNKHYICFNNKFKRFEDPDPKKAISMAIDWLKGSRKEENSATKYTLH